MTVEVDSSGQRYVDTPTLYDEHVRTTYIPAEKAGYREDSVRIQIRDARGHIRKGPEVPLSAIGGMVAAIIELLRAE